MVLELRFMDHRRLGGFLDPASWRLGSDDALAPGSTMPKAALSDCELLRLKKLDIVRLTPEMELRVDRREMGVGMPSGSGAFGVGGGRRVWGEVSVVFGRGETVVSRASAAFPVGVASGCRGERTVLDVSDAVFESGWMSWWP